MEIKPGDRFFNLSTGDIYKVTEVTDNFLLWKCWYKDQWITVMHPIRIEYLLRDIEKRWILPDTAANRILYGRF